MFEHHPKGERALIVHLTITSFHEQPALEEFVELVLSAGATVIAQVTGSRKVPDAAFFVGRGKLEELEALVAAEAIDVVLFNHELSPGQERNLERAIRCRVIDRSGVILDIFAQRARSFEGKLQVELAQLQYLSTRLIRGWTHLERQRGGIGLRGPGETQLETDRRLLAERIKHINKRLDKVKQQRQLSRRARQRAEIPIVSLVGYTNAGKSTLFNRLTTASVYTADQLFATLDATLRRLELPHKVSLVLADTVGFIHHLPPSLVAAFRATLEEICESTLLLHVVDASSEQRQFHIEQVNIVLEEIEASAIPQIILYNKIDCVPESVAHNERNQEGRVTAIWLSAQKGTGIELLSEALSEHLNKNIVQQWVRVPVQVPSLRARLFAAGIVLREQFAADGDSLLEIQTQAPHLKQLLATEDQLQLVTSLAHLS